MEKFTRRGMMIAAAGAVAAGAAGAEKPAAGGEKPAAGRRDAFDVRDWGAVGDGKTMNTAAIAKTIEAAAAAGGGVVYFPSGNYVSGAIVLRDNITLHLAESCAILGSADKADYGERSELGLIYGEGVRNVAIVGRGAVVGRGANFPVKNNSGGRPFLVRLIDCKDVLLQDAHFSESAAWGIHLKRCERAFVRGITIFNHVNANNDGIDIDSCKDVALTGCAIDADDDAICLKSESGGRCENIMISDCLASSHCNAIKAGTGSKDGFVNVTIANCTVVAPRYSKKINGEQRGISGISLEVVDGGEMDRVTVSGIVIDGVMVPLFLRLGDRARAKGTPGTMKNIVISNLVATNTGTIGSSIAGVPGQIIENVTLSDITLGYEGGGTSEDAKRTVPEKEKSYPESKMFGTLPAWGLYCRHVKGLKLRNVRLATAAPDARHAVVIDDGRDVEIDGLDAPHTAGAAALVKMSGVRGALVRGCRPAIEDGAFIGVAGRDSRGIALVGNDLRGAAKTVETAPDAAQDAAALGGNLGGFT